MDLILINLTAFLSSMFIIHFSSSKKFGSQHPKFILICSMPLSIEQSFGTAASVAFVVGRVLSLPGVFISLDCRWELLSVKG